MPRDDQKLDLNTRVVTPENIEFEYELAGPFQRLPAYLMDLFIWNASFFGLVLLCSILLGMIGFNGLDQFLGFLVFLGWFLVSWFYGIFFESVYNGRTPGKAMLKLRVISIDGRPINGLQAGIRNLLRTADLMVLLSVQMFVPDGPPAYLFPTMIIGLTCMTLTSRMQRLGDLAAGTMVISEQKRYSPWNLQPDDVRAYGIAELIPGHFAAGSSLSQAVGLYMENRLRLRGSRREEIAAKIALPLIRQLALPSSTNPDLLLCALYVRLYMPEEQQKQGLEWLRQAKESVARQGPKLNFSGSSAASPYDTALATPPIVSPPLAQTLPKPIATEAPSSLINPESPSESTGNTER
jgi:uncharacterized RDD family membrane protein YckC